MASAHQLDLQARHARAQARYVRACLTIERSRRLIEWSRTMTRYKTARIRGGADDHVRLIARLRDLITAGALPRNRPAKMFVGPSLDAHACILCREKFTHGEIEYEFEMDSHAIYLHRRCFDLWRELDAESETAP